MRPILKSECKARAFSQFTAINRNTRAAFDRTAGGMSQALPPCKASTRTHVCEFTSLPHLCVWLVAAGGVN